MLAENVFALFQTDGVDDCLPLHAFQPGFDDLPFGGVNHHRHAGDVRFGGDQIQKAGHARHAIEHTVIEIDINHLRAIFHLLGGNADGFFIIFFVNQAPESRRTGDICPLADVDEIAERCDRQRFQPAESRFGFVFRHGARLKLLHRFGDGADVVGGCAAAAANDVHESVLGKIAQLLGDFLRRLVILTEFVRQPGVGIAGNVRVGDICQRFQIRTHFRRAERAVQPDAERFGVHNRVPEGFGGLPGEGAPAGIGNGAGNHHRHTAPNFLKKFIHPEKGGFGVQRVENSFDEQQFHPAVQQSARLLFVCRFQVIERDIPRAGVVHIRRKRGGFVGWSHRTGDISRFVRRFRGEFIGGGAGNLCRGAVHFIHIRLRAVIRLRDGGGVKSVGFQNIRARRQIFAVNLGDNLRLGE